MNKLLVFRILVGAFLLSLTAVAHAAANALPEAGEEQNSPQLQKVASAAELGIRFDRYSTEDKFGRTITFYLSTPPEDKAVSLPLVLFVDGSGCQSAFRQWGDRVTGGLFAGVGVVCCAGSGTGDDCGEAGGGIFVPAGTAGYGNWCF